MPVCFKGISKVQLKIQRPAIIEVTLKLKVAATIWK